MVGKVYIKRVSGYDPRLGKSVRDPALDAKEARDKRKKDKGQERERVEG